MNEEELRVHLLSTSAARLAAIWEEVELLPDTEHPGLASVIDRRHIGEEDLILSARRCRGAISVAVDVIDEAAKEAAKAGIATFDPTAAETWLVCPRREMYRSIDERIANFARCGISSVDDWR